MLKANKRNVLELAITASLMFVSSFNIGLRFELSLASIILCIKAISEFRFDGLQIRKSSFAKVGCREWTAVRTAFINSKGGKRGVEYLTLITQN